MKYVKAVKLQADVQPLEVANTYVIECPSCKKEQKHKFFSTQSQLFVNCFGCYKPLYSFIDNGRVLFTSHTMPWHKEVYG